MKKFIITFGLIVAVLIGVILPLNSALRGLGTEQDLDPNCGCYLSLWSQDYDIVYPGRRVEISWSAYEFAPYTHPYHYPVITVEMTYYWNGLILPYTEKYSRNDLDGTFTFYPPPACDSFSYTIIGVEKQTGPHYQFNYGSAEIGF